MPDQRNCVRKSVVIRENILHLRIRKLADDANGHGAFPEPAKHSTVFCS